MLVCGRSQCCCCFDERAVTRTTHNARSTRTTHHSHTHTTSKQTHTTNRAADGRKVAFIEQKLAERGAAFDVAVFDATAAPPQRLNLTALLWNADGPTGRYRGVVTYPPLEAIGDLTAAEVEALWDYQRRTGARSARWAAWPSTVGFAPNQAACAANAQALRFTAAAPLAGSGVPPDAALSSSGLYKCPGDAAQPLAVCGIWANDFAGTGIITPCTAKPILTTEPAPQYGAAWKDAGAAGVLVK